MRRSHLNPIITRRDIPEIEPHLVDVSSVFNPGAVKFGNTCLLMIRVQNRGRETFLLTAQSGDGIRFQIDKTVVHFAGLEKLGKTVYHIYDPRITAIDNVYYIMFAMDMDEGCYLGLAKTEGFREFEFMGIVSSESSRNGVLFPERINGKYLRLDRPCDTPLPGGTTSGSEICLSESGDLLNWRKVKTVMTGRLHYWDELIGSGPPPVKTEKGWLHIYHGIATHFASSNIYQAGVVLLDLDDPSKVLARSRYNIFEPREAYELTGQVPNVVFPSGMIVARYNQDGFADLNSLAMVYYGAADTSIGLATTTVHELIDACYMGSDDGCK